MSLNSVLIWTLSHIQAADGLHEKEVVAIKRPEVGPFQRQRIGPSRNDDVIALLGSMAKDAGKIAEDGTAELNYVRTLRPEVLDNVIPEALGEHECIGASVPREDVVARC